MGGLLDRLDNSISGDPGQVGSTHSFPHSSRKAMILPPASMDLGLLLISIGVVNLWRARQGA